MNNKKQHHLPFEPLESWLRSCCQPTEGGGDGGIADRLETSPQNLSVYRKRGVTIPLADRLATRCGMHPSAFWPEWFDLA